MAAPAPTVRQTPAGRKLKDGMFSRITLAIDPDISFWEKVVKPPGITNGDPIPQTTMFNVDWETKAPQAINDMTNVTGTVAYDPAVKSQIDAAIGVETTITVTFWDGSTWAMYGYLMLFDPQDMQKGEQPEAEIEFVITNYDNTNNVEAGPLVTAVSGT